MTLTTKMGFADYFRIPKLPKIELPELPIEGTAKLEVVLMVDLVSGIATGIYLICGGLVMLTMAAFLFRSPRFPFAPPNNDNPGM